MLEQNRNFRCPSRIEISGLSPQNFNFYIQRELVLCMSLQELNRAKIYGQKFIN